MTPQVTVCKDRGSWLEHRKAGLGASDASAVLGISPWKTNVELWEEKTGRRTPEDIGDKPQVRYGNDAEPLLRSFFALDHPEYRLTFTPYKIIRHEKYPFISCTPDGELEEIATGRKGGLEIKTTEILSSTGWGKWKDRIPDEYYAQVCQQMLAADWEFVELLVQIKYTVGGPRRAARPGGGRTSSGMSELSALAGSEGYGACEDEGEDRKEVRHYKIERSDCREDIDMVGQEAVRFWACVQEGRRPPLKLPPI